MIENNVSSTISIIMATYNRSHFICETLDSILSQTFSNWECIIIDDGSTDSTREVLQPYLIKDPRLKYYSRKNNHKKGLPGCRNLGLELAKGDYIIFFDDDDIVHPDNLKICMKLIAEENVDYVRYLREVFVGDFLNDFDRSNSFNLNSLTIEDLPKVITGETPFNSCQILWRKECFKNNFFNENLMYAEEWECYSRILCNPYNGLSINKTLFYGRKHPHSNTGQFQNNDPVRKRSKILAAKEIINNLKNHALLSKALKKYFIRLSFTLKSYELLKFTLANTTNSNINRIKYVIGFKLYPILKILLKVKGRILKI